MKIEQLDSPRILISLGEKDMTDYALTFDTISLEDPHAGHILKQLMHHACAETGISLHNKQVLIEAMQYEHGCLLLLTVSDKHRRKTYHIKRNGHCLTFCFHSADDLLHCIQTLCHLHERHPHSAVYRYGNAYYLCLPSSLPITRRCRYIAGEFADGCRFGRPFLAFLQEHAQVLQPDDAIRTIGHLLEHKRKRSFEVQ